MPSSDPMQYVVRCGTMRTLGVMAASRPFRYGDAVVVRTDRGTELGTVLCEATPTAIDAMTDPTAGRILRTATTEDQNQWERIDSSGEADMAICQTCVDALGLVMELVEVERILGGERLVVYFIADGRVDFRQLVRDLAREFQTRIEMRQIGVRDEAKLLADYGDCGQPICCSRFLSKMPPVSMKMAKIQRATLDPAKISGRCGRLKCCLRYEFETYEALARELPSLGSLILTRDGNATVLATDVLSSQVTVLTDDKRRVLVHRDDIVRVLEKGSGESKRRRGRGRSKTRKPKED